MKTGYLLALLLVAAFALKSEAEYKYAFEAFKENFNKVYRGDEFRRYQIFKTNVDYIEKMNSKGLSYTLGINQFVDMTKTEFNAMFHDMMPGKADKPEKMVEYTSEYAPDAVDWQKQGAVYSVKNQGQCGSCWAFAAAAAIESAVFIESKKLEPLSEQNFVDCVEECSGCNGGNMNSAYEYTIDNGVCYEKDYPYTAKDEECTDDKCEKKVSIDDYDIVQQYSEESLKQAVAIQPVSVGIQANQDGFRFYKSGVMDGECGAQVNHGVLAVGYGEEGGKKFWKLKNSWGPNWGDKGYIKILRKEGYGSAGHCGITLMASYPTIESKNDEYTTETLVVKDCSKGKARMQELKMTFDPVQPEAGKPLRVRLTADVKERIDYGSGFFEVVWNGASRVVHEPVGNVCAFFGVSCPINPGKFDVTKTYNVPSFWPMQADYLAHLDLNVRQGDEVICIEGTWEYPDQE